MEVGHSLTQNVESIRRLISNRIHYSKHSKPNSFKFFCMMIQVQSLVNEFTRILQSWDYIRKYLRVQFYPFWMWLSGWLEELIMRVEKWSTSRTNIYLVSNPLYWINYITSNKLKLKWLHSGYRVRLNLSISYLSLKDGSLKENLDQSLTCRMENLKI